MSYDVDYCLRDYKDRIPLSNVVSDEEPKTFVCVGYNSVENRSVHGDRFCHCIKSSMDIDDECNADRRDLLDTIRVLSAALSFDEQLRVAVGLTDEGMNDKNLVLAVGGEIGEDEPQEKHADVEFECENCGKVSTAKQNGMYTRLWPECPFCEASMVSCSPINPLPSRDV